jgi:hypothetical protein
MGRYEIQILNSYNNRTYADGQAGSIYAQYPPLVNASRKPGEWQTYDIIFHGPRFNEYGTLIKPARMTALHNGVLIQDNVELTGPSNWQSKAPYTAHGDKGHISLQDHGHPVRYRNMWLRELHDRAPRDDPRNLPVGKHAVALTPAITDAIAGHYANEDDSYYVDITVEQGRVYAKLRGWSIKEIFADSETEFSEGLVDRRYTFVKNDDGEVTGIIAGLGVDSSHLSKKAAE